LLLLLLLLLFLRLLLVLVVVSIEPFRARFDGGTPLLAAPLLGFVVG
jgi:hypothetical protein